MPYLASNVPAVYEKIQNDSLRFPPKCAISAELKDLIEQMLEKDPAKRITLPKIKVRIKIVYFATNDAFTGAVNEQAKNTFVSRPTEPAQPVAQRKLCVGALLLFMNGSEINASFSALAMILVWYIWTVHIEDGMSITVTLAVNI